MPRLEPTLLTEEDEIRFKAVNDCRSYVADEWVSLISKQASIKIVKRNVIDDEIEDFLLSPMRLKEEESIQKAVKLVDRRKISATQFWF